VSYMYVSVVWFGGRPWLLMGSCLVFLPIVCVYIVRNPNPEMPAAAKDAALRKVRKQFYSRGRRFACF
jgi:hypothetical protein